MGAIAKTTIVFAFSTWPAAAPARQPAGAAVLVGVIVDEQHRPVARAQVQAFTIADARTLSNPKRLIHRAYAYSDASGAFRITGLAAGEYIVAAEPMPIFPNGGMPPARAYGATFYPSALDVSQAVAAFDHPAATIQIELIPVKTGSTVARIDTKGTFEIPRVPPGVYGLTIQPHDSRPDQERRDFLDTTIEARDRNLNLSLTLGSGALITGRVVAEPAGSISTPIGTRVIVDGGTAVAADSGVRLREGAHDVTIFIASRQAPKPTVDASLTVNALVDQFKTEKIFWKQMDVAKAIVEKRDASVLPQLADWLRQEDRHIRGNVAFIFGSLGDPRGLLTIADILTDRSQRSEAQGIAMAPSDGRYRFEQQVAADRYYAAHLLGDLRDPRGIALLVPLLHDRETQSIVPWSLGQIGDKRAIPPLLASLDNDDPSMRVLSIDALETLHATEAIPRLLALVDDNRRSHFGAGVTVSEAAKAAIAKLR